MSTRIIIDNIAVVNNPAPFLAPIHLDITFTALSPIPQLLEWKVIYVGSAKDESYDQVLEQFQIGPINEQSTMKFTVQCPAPDYSRIPADELICVTAMIITVSYRQQQFIRVGYYVHNLLTETLPEEDRPNATQQQLATHARRTILTDKPRITKFRINWDHNHMKEETNNNKMNMESPYNSNSSLLAKKMGERHQEEKQSTREEKQYNSQSIMKSQCLFDKEEARREESV